MKRKKWRSVDESVVEAAVEAIKQKIGGGRAPRRNDDNDDSEKYTETLSVGGSLDLVDPSSRNFNLNSV